MADRYRSEFYYMTREAVAAEPQERYTISHDLYHSLLAKSEKLKFNPERRYLVVSIVDDIPMLRLFEGKDVTKMRNGHIEGMLAF